MKFNILNTLNYMLSPNLCIICENMIEENNFNLPILKNTENNKKNLILHHICDNCLFNLPLINNHDETKIEILKNIKIEELYIDNFYSLIDNKLNNDYIKLVYELKYNKRQNIAFTIGYLISKLLNSINNNNNKLIPKEKYSFIVPVPLHKARLRERGFNQADLIASSISQNTDIPIKKLIERTINNQTQTKLSQQDRKNNIIEIFKANKSLKESNTNINLSINNNQRVLIVDDVLTTGATVNSIAKELFNLGFKYIDVATFIKA